MNELLSIVYCLLGSFFRCVVKILWAFFEPWCGDRSLAVTDMLENVDSLGTSNLAIYGHTQCEPVYGYTEPHSIIRIYNTAQRRRVDPFSTLINDFVTLWSSVIHSKINPRKRRSPWPLAQISDLWVAWTTCWANTSWKGRHAKNVQMFSFLKSAS